MALAGAVLGGRYVLSLPIGSGGYSEVWHATDTVLLRPVAVKLLHPRYAQRAEARARFQAEARHAGALSHENIARVYDYGEPDDGQPSYLVMELVNGPSLEGVLAGGPLDACRTMDVVAQTAAGLSAAHAAGLLHRDIKPANILLAPGGVVKIADFGIAHTVGSVPVTATGEVIGTPGYLAPERLAGEHATPASDLYALGMVAYECLAGQRPFTGPPLVVALAHRERPLPPLPLSVLPSVAELVMQLAAKDPAWRPGSAAEVAAWAGQLRDGRPAAIAAPARRVSVPRLRRRSALTCASIAIAAVIGSVLASVTGFASPHQAGPWHSGRTPSTGTAAQRGTAAQPGTVPGPGSGRLPAASPVAQQGPASIAPAVAPASPGHKQGHGHRHGRSHGHG